jgi:hypothetical protein
VRCQTSVRSGHINTTHLCERNIVPGTSLLKGIGLGVCGLLTAKPSLAVPVVDFNSRLTSNIAAGKQGEDQLGTQRVQFRSAPIRYEGVQDATFPRTILGRATDNVQRRKSGRSLRRYHHQDCSHGLPAVPTLNTGMPTLIEPGRVCDRQQLGGGGSEELVPMPTSPRHS